MKRLNKAICFPHAITQCPGDTMKDVYELDISPNGEKKLICTGTVDINEQINAHKDSCDLKTILERHNMMGTLDSLAHSEGNGIVDLTRVPNNLHEVKKLLDNADKIYNNLKPEVKAKYETLEDFLSVFGSVGTLRTFLLQNRQSAVSSDAEGTKEVKGGDAV